MGAAPSTAQLWQLLLNLAAAHQADRGKRRLESRCGHIVESMGKLLCKQAQPCAGSARKHIDPALPGANCRPLRVHWSRRSSASYLKVAAPNAWACGSAHLVFRA